MGNTIPQKEDYWDYYTGSNIETKSFLLLLTKMSKEFFEEKTVVQLKALAKKKKVVLENGLKKAEIIDRLMKGTSPETPKLPPRLGGTKPYLINFLLIDNGFPSRNVNFIGRDLFDTCSKIGDFLKEVIEFLVIKKFDFTRFKKSSQKICKGVKEKYGLEYWQTYFDSRMLKALLDRDQEEIYNLVAILGEKTGYKKSRAYIIIPSEKEIVT